MPYIAHNRESQTFDEMPINPAQSPVRSHDPITQNSFLVGWRMMVRRTSGASRLPPRERQPDFTGIYRIHIPTSITKRRWEAGLRPLVRLFGSFPEFPPSAAFCRRDVTMATLLVGVTWTP